MYEQLIKELQYCGRCSKCRYRLDSMCVDKILKAAVDALEEMSRMIEQLTAGGVD